MEFKTKFDYGSKVTFITSDQNVFVAVHEDEAKPLMGDFYVVEGEVVDIKITTEKGKKNEPKISIQYDVELTEGNIHRMKQDDLGKDIDDLLEIIRQRDIIKYKKQPL